MDEDDIAERLAADRQTARNISNSRGASTDEAENKKNDANPNMVKKASGEVLKFSWENIITTFGFSIFLIDFFVFLRMIMPDMICALGEEWLPKEAVQADPEKAKTAVKKIGMIENMGCACVNLAVLAMILIAILFVVVLVAPQLVVGTALYAVFSSLIK